MTKLLQSATILEVKDVVASEAFYREKLGFAPGSFHGEPPVVLRRRPRPGHDLLDQSQTPRATPLNQY